MLLFFSVLLHFQHMTDIQWIIDRIPSIVSVQYYQKHYHLKEGPSVFQYFIHEKLPCWGVLAIALKTITTFKEL